MNVRSHVASVFHLDKCLGCHTCSVACKNVWTDREGAEYMWWNNVETKPGTGYPTRWEDQTKYQGGWQRENGSLRLKSTSKLRILTNIFHHPHMPTLDEYYEPWTYDYGHLFSAPEDGDQPVARPVSMITGQPIEIESGPNWDDDLGGSPVYAEQDPNFHSLTAEERAQLFAIERLVFFYLPRSCNHCLNPACVAACPSGAIYKRGEDGIVLIDQQRCRAWRACVAACPYKKTFYNWRAGKSEKCIYCFPRIESGQAPACFQACAGRIRYTGVLLYDAERLLAVAGADQHDLIDSHRSLILDPCDPAVVNAAERSGIPASTIEAAQRSPVFRFVKQWKLALPLHAEFRTLPMTFYVPPMLPIRSTAHDGIVEQGASDVFHEIDDARVPLQYFASLFAAGNQRPVRYALRKQQAIRWQRRAATVGDVPAATVRRILQEADCTPEEADAIYRLTTVSGVDERFVVPPAHRELQPDGRVGGA
jgi:nitrate reductase / nitrite oxidoreductase, beta subunit